MTRNQITHNWHTTMQHSLSIGVELDRIIRQLGHSPTEITLLSVSTGTLPVATLRSTLRAAANDSHTIGLLPDGSVGIFGLCGVGGDDAQSLEEQFIPRLRTMLQRICDDTGFGRTAVSFRSVKRRADELRDGDDLMQILLDRPLRSFVVGAQSAMFPILHTIYAQAACV